MLLQNDRCKIKIAVDETYTLDSVDNKPYNRVINPLSLKRNDFYKVFSIEIALSHETISIALVGNFYSYDTDCAVLDHEILTILQNNVIVQIKVGDGTMLHYKTFDCFGCNFGIYKVKEGYIIYGEMEITMLDLNFNKQWGFSGGDAFVSISGKKPFELCDNTIKLFDFEDNFYEIDLNGTLVHEA